MRNTEYRLLGFIKIKKKYKAIELYDFQIEYNKVYYLWNIPVFKVTLSEMDLSDVITYDPRKTKELRVPYCLKSKHPDLVENK